MNEVVSLYISPKAGQPMEAVDSIVVDFGGIVGDRYHIDSVGYAHGIFSSKPGKIGRIDDHHREVTFISRSGIAIGNEKLGQIDSKPMVAQELRRNIKVDVDHILLNMLVGRLYVRYCSI